MSFEPTQRFARLRTYYDYPGPYLQIPCRYVSGYSIAAKHAHWETTHAWVEAYT
jgi:hypothetical protein